jgi:hypothetical protein
MVLCAVRKEEEEEWIAEHLPIESNLTGARGGPGFDIVPWVQTGSGKLQ